MSIDIDRHTRLHEVLVSDGGCDLTEMVMWPALAALSVETSPVATRRCAQAFVQLAADVLALENGGLTSDSAQWRRAVVDLATAYQQVAELLTEVGDDPAQQALAAILRQMLSVAEAVADWLAGRETTDSLDLNVDVLPAARDSATAHRRRPWFGADVPGDTLWGGEHIR